MLVVGKQSWRRVEMKKLKLGGRKIEEDRRGRRL